MKKYYSTPKILISLFLLIAFGCSRETVRYNNNSIEELRSLFADPPSEFRSAPLWDWNEQITKEGIDFHMKEFKKAGIGGVFVHPRPGLLTEYLSDKWFDLFDYTVQKGKELDMKVWIYDENSYPSGFAGGHVPAEMPDSYKHGTGLQLEIQDQLNISSSDTLEVVLKKSDDGFEDITDSTEGETGKKGTYYIFRKTYPSSSPWYGGFTYVDLLYPGVTDKFIKVTMTEGYERNMEDFGKTLPGVFTDEPNLEAAIARGSVMRWTPGLWNDFEQRWGYDLRPELPSLVEETGNWQKIRHDYYELILELFVDHWAKPWNKYCEENGLKWTGHYWEHGWPEPTHGFDEAAFYIWHQQPGVDMLGNQLVGSGLGRQFGNDRAVRELRSAANQAGRSRTLSETYGGGGWEMDFETQKRLADWQGVLGVNFVNQHLSYYSLNGVRKFDYPPSFSYHEPWWEHYILMGDYIGRISIATSFGEQINKTLVLQPNTTAWMYFSRKNRNPKIEEIRNGFKKFVYQLEQQHIEYDLGSENVIKTLGSAKENKLSVGKRNYSLIVIPASMENMDNSTFELISKYVENGGKILSFNKNVSLIDGVESSAVTELAEKFPKQWIFVSDIQDPKALDMLKNNNFEINDISQNGMLYHQRRILNDGQLLFMVNSHETEKAVAEVSIEGKFLIKMDLTSGEEFIWPVTKKKGKLNFNINLDPNGSALFAAVDKKPEGLQETAFHEKNEIIEGDGNIKVERKSDNIFVINYLDLKTSKSDKKDIYFMDALIGLYKESGIEMGNPWQHKIQYKKNYLALDSLFEDKPGFEAAYHFRINENLNDKAKQTIRAVVERSELWKVSINGNWIDKDFSVFSIGKYLKQGNNTLTLKAPRMHILAEVMPVYLLGDFLVKPAIKGFEITGGEFNGLGSWKEAGLPFYSQEVSYSEKFEVKKTGDMHYKVRLGEWNGSVAEVRVNGEEAGLIAWPPYELDVTSLLKDGKNKIDIKITGSLKNTFGHFYSDNDNWIFGPHTWNNAPEKIPSADEYFLMDYGLFEPFGLVEME